MVCVIVIKTCINAYLMYRLVLLFRISAHTLYDGDSDDAFGMEMGEEDGVRNRYDKNDTDDELYHDEKGIYGNSMNESQVRDLTFTIFYYSLSPKAETFLTLAFLRAASLS